MNPELPIGSMPEAEVTLRLVISLLRLSGSGSYAKVAIDGAHVRIKAHYVKDRRVDEQIIFDIAGFLKEHGCRSNGQLKDGWQGSYTCNGSSFEIKAGRGFDVQLMTAGRWVRVECKGGPLVPTKGKSPNAILASAIGQVICEECVTEGDDLWVAVPDSGQFFRTTERIARVSAFRKSGIRIALVSRHGGIRVALPSESMVTWQDVASYFA